MKEPTPVAQHGACPFWTEHSQGRGQHSPRGLAQWSGNVEHIVRGRNSQLLLA